MSARANHTGLSGPAEPSVQPESHPQSSEAPQQGPEESPASLRRSRASTLDQLMPAILFFTLYNVVPEPANVIAAVLAATAWSIKAAIGRRRRGLSIGWWLPGLTIYLLVRAAVTVAADRGVVDFGISTEAVYFGIGFTTKFLAGIALGITILVGRPFLAWAVPRVLAVPAEVVAAPRYVRTMANATWLVVAFEILSACWDVWLFNNSGVNLFLVTRTGVNFVASTIAIAAGMFYIDRRLSGIDGYPGLVHLIDSQGAGSLEGASPDGVKATSDQA